MSIYTIRGSFIDDFIIFGYENSPQYKTDLRKALWGCLTGKTADAGDCVQGPNVYNSAYPPMNFGSNERMSSHICLIGTCGARII